MRRHGAPLLEDESSSWRCTSAVIEMVCTHHGVPSSKIDRAFDLERRQRPRDWWHKAAPYITLVFRQHPQRAQQRECLLVLVVLLVRWRGAGRACARCPPLARERYSRMRRMQRRHPAQRKALAIDSAALANVDQRTKTYTCIPCLRTCNGGCSCQQRPPPPRVASRSSSAVIRGVGQAEEGALLVVAHSSLVIVCASSRLCLSRRPKHSAAP